MFSHLVLEKKSSKYAIQELLTTMLLLHLQPERKNSNPRNWDDFLIQFLVFVLKNRYEIKTSVY